MLYILKVNSSFGYTVFLLKYSFVINFSIEPLVLFGEMDLEIFFNEYHWI